MTLAPSPIGFKKRQSLLTRRRSLGRCVLSILAGTSLELFTDVKHHSLLDDAPR